MISDVYKTKPAMANVKIMPGTRPRYAYEYGNDMIARQMYSLNSSAAVWRSIRSCFFEIALERHQKQNIWTQQKYCLQDC